MSQLIWIYSAGKIGFFLFLVLQVLKVETLTSMSSPTARDSTT